MTLESNTEGAPEGVSNGKRSGFDKPPERWISFLGFVIVTKSDLLAATAFVLSMISVAYQISSWANGASPSVYPPDLVYVTFDQYANNRTVVRFVSQLSFVNTADAGRDAIVRSVSLNVTAGRFNNVQEWLSFVTVRRVEMRLQVEPRESAHPFPVSGGGAVSQTVSFAPFEQACPPQPSQSEGQACNSDVNFVAPAEFLSQIEAATQMRLTFRVNMVGFSRPLTTSCTIPIGTAFRQYMAENGWYSARCYPAEALSGRVP
ncbi:MAG: hypothetical protein JWR10_2458 [Rubritepida sp.]|nr:hypothetical protein [Rubritepida sp.]